MSSFHGWLPFVLIWGVWRLGYDRRAFIGWTIISTVILLISFLLAPKPPAPAENPDLAVNINYVHGMSYEKTQTVMHPWLWLGIMIVGFPLVFYLPAHLAFRPHSPTAQGVGCERECPRLSHPVITLCLERQASQFATGRPPPAPDRLDQPERPGALKEPIGRTQNACAGERQCKPRAAILERVADQHGGDGEESEKR